MSSNDEPYDVAVVGLGALGSAIVRPLAERGARVLGLDRHAPPHDLGSSHGESRITRLAIGEGDAYVPLVRRSHAIWRALERQTGVPLYEATGGLVLGSERSRRTHHGKPDFLQRTIGSAQRHGIAHELLDAREIRRRFPPFALRGDEIGYWEPEAGLVRPEQAIRAQLAVARASGAHLRTGETVLALEPHGDGSVTLATDQGRYRARQVVLSAGAWLPGLLQGLGQDAWAAWAGEFAVYRQVMHWYALQPDAAPAFVPGRFPVFIWMYGDGEEDYFYGFPSLDPQQPALKVATEQYAAPTTPEALRREVGVEEAAAMHASRVAGRFPQAGPQALQSRACMYTVTRDRDFVVDRLGDGLPVWVASACSGHGFKHSAGLGEAIALKLLDVGTGALLASFQRRAAPVAQAASPAAAPNR
ncbi:N-methyl-L-tryptophan oxidase [Pseudorhodoferax sp. Leaf265]|jgi:sarcosine oxidase|uniref:N-methyl-L-tryptophan oxidase n=1 Tax=Pseudorhodoferax sp. Leaf265 TaxID=1736315 RepID=UPI0006F819AE|nr:N-methyl-L-tryptophan oxidase [Pseudorhodoferax sp. Leaf265]KQP04466.1 methyltryptophan oxidase [Pseudorhodoferax sp. Leaf265]